MRSRVNYYWNVWYPSNMTPARKLYLKNYQRAWMAERRKSFFTDKHCETCGSKEQLELHHKDPDTKTAHSIWSWSTTRRKAEISKCSVLCHACHRQETNAYLKKIFTGMPGRTRKLSDGDVRDIRRRVLAGETTRSIGARYGVCHTAISDIHRGATYRYLK